MALIDELKEQKQKAHELYHSFMRDAFTNQSFADIEAQRERDLDRAIAALEPEAPPAVEKPDTLYTGEFGDEQGDEAGAPTEWPDPTAVAIAAHIEVESEEQPEQLLVDAASGEGAGTMERDPNHNDEPSEFGKGWASGWAGHDRSPHRNDEWQNGYEEGTKDRATGIAVGNPHVPNYDGTQPEALSTDNAAASTDDACNNGDEAGLQTPFPGRRGRRPETSHISQSEAETHTDGVRTAEGETGAGDDRIETQSVLDDPDLKAAVQRGHDLLAQAGVTTLAYDSAAEPAYIGLQDADLDAEFDAMKAREEASKPKPRFNIWGGKREKVDA